MLLFCDSFDHYATADILEKWTTTNFGNMSIASNGRFGTSNLRGSASNNGAWEATWVNPAGNLQTWIVGAAVAGAFSNPSVLNWRVFALVDSGTTQLTLKRNMSTGVLELYRGDGTTLLASGTTTILASTYYYVEMKAKIDNSTGAVTVKLNGVTELTYSGDTAASANNSADRLTVVGSTGISSTLTCDYDDLYIADTTGSILNDFIGDARVVALTPNGNGNSSQLVGSDGNSTNNYQLVDESPPNDDTDYVESSTAGDKDTYTFSDLSQANGTIYGVQININAKKTDAGSRSIASVARLSGTESDGPTTTLTTSYKDIRDVRETDPSSAQWTITNVNSAEFGVKIVS